MADLRDYMHERSNVCGLDLCEAWNSGATKPLLVEDWRSPSAE